MKAILGPGEFPKNPIEIEIGGSKSESNRLLILQAQFPNISIKNLSQSDDTQVLQKSVKILKGTVDIHHAGTAMRFLTAYYAGKEGAEITLTGSKRMQERPIGILVDALKSLGADIEYLQSEGYPPLRIKGRTFQNNEVSIQSNVSSQYISALLLTAPSLPNGLSIFLQGKPISEPYLQMTLSLLNRIGVKTNFRNNRIDIFPVREIEDVEIVVESDWSSASYFYSLVALSNGLKITLRNFLEESLQGDSDLPTIYKTLGVQTNFDIPEKSISISKKKIKLPAALMLDLSKTPDLAQTIVVTCFGLGIGCGLSGLQTLKIKETDRLLALKNELSKLGAIVHIDDSSLQLEKSSQTLSNGIIKTFQDHRMAMAFAPLATKGNLSIEDAEVVSKSYPNFWKDLRKTGIFCDLVDSSK